jgi:hypothetical protein
MAKGAKGKAKGGAKVHDPKGASYAKVGKGKKSSKLKM